MKNYLCRLSYLGAFYKGFERQKDHPSIQGELERALTSLLGKESFIHGAGRTDAGVNAKKAAFSFLSERPIESYSSFLYAFNRLLPRDIAVLSIEEKPLIFDARHSSAGKVYSYSFRVGRKEPLGSLVVTQLGERPFSIPPFLSALSLYNGNHNWKDFTTKKDDKDNFMRDVEVICDLNPDSISPFEGKVIFKGNGFMTYMVRIMMGVAFKAAYLQIDDEYIKNHLDVEQRHIVSFKAPPEGLCLEDVIYE